MIPYRTMISIHPPREGWDLPVCLEGFPLHIQFQSTHPVRGGTWMSRSCPGMLCDFNPPTP